MFKQNSMFGIPMNPTTVLALSIALSMRSCVNLHQKTIQVHKGFFPLASEIGVWIWGLFGALRRILAIVTYFIPFLGLFDILYHWKADQIPFGIRSYESNQNPNDKIELRGLIKTVLWGELDQWNYSVPNFPTPPSYTLYTYFTLEGSFKAFLILMSVHILTMLVIKIATSAEFRNRDNIMKKCLHVIQNLSLATPYQDWDEGVHTIPEYKRRFRRTNIEMACCLTLNIVVSLVMLVPLLYTGKPFNLTFSYTIHDTS